MDEGDYRQALDYAYVLMCAYSNSMEKCELVKQNKHVNNAYQQVGLAMVYLYQLIGNNAFWDTVE